VVHQTKELSLSRVQQEAGKVVHVWVAYLLVCCLYTILPPILILPRFLPTQNRFFFFFF
jgi:hypothetical protein